MVVPWGKVEISGIVATVASCSCCCCCCSCCVGLPKSSFRRMGGRGGDVSASLDGGVIRPVGGDMAKVGGGGGGGW